MANVSYVNEPSKFGANSPAVIISPFGDEIEKLIFLAC